MWNVVELTERLCAIPSVTGEEQAVVSCVASLAEALGLSVTRQAVGAVPGRDNLLAVFDGVTPEVLLTTHLDTVPPFIPPTRTTDRLLGRGTCDAKGIAAAMLCAVERLAAAGERRVGLLFVVGEETDSDGAKAAATGFAPRVRYLINGEPTELKLAVAMKGAVVFELEAEGRAGHSAYPETGHSALHQLVDDISRLLGQDWPADSVVGKTTLNIGTLEGGVAPNVIAAHARARCVMRTSTDAASLVEEIRSIVDPNTRVAVTSSSSPVYLEGVDGVDTCVVAFGSDIPYLRPLGTPLLIGPGSIHDAHTAHEFVLLEDLERAVTLYQQLVVTLLARPS